MSSSWYKGAEKKVCGKKREQDMHVNSFPLVSMKTTVFESGKRPEGIFCRNNRETGEKEIVFMVGVKRTFWLCKQSLALPSSLQNSLSSNIPSMSI